MLGVLLNEEFPSCPNARRIYPMLKTDPTALRFWGLTLRSRTKRRLVVTLTYAVYVIAMAVIADRWKSDAVLQNYHFGFFMMLLLSVLVGLLGVFRAGGP